MVDVVEFFQHHVLPELQATESSHPIIIADSIKFATAFRNQLPKEAYSIIIGTLAPFLAQSACPPVTVSYIAHCIERLLTVRDKQADGTAVSRLTREEMAPALEGLLGGLFSALDRDDMTENEYVMKAIMRLVTFGRETLMPHVQLCMEKLVAKLAAAAANPVNPTFNHFLFETIASMVRHVTAVHPEAIEAFEESLFPLIQHMLDQDIVEFGPYAIQLLSQLLGIRAGSGTVPEQYLAILPPLFLPVFWERPGYIPALTHLVQNYLRCAGPMIVSNGQLQPILGIFQKLISSKANDMHGFSLFTSMIQALPLEAISEFLPTIFQLLCTRLSTL